MSLELQKKIFEDKLTRRDLLSYETKMEKKHLVQVFRNHSFELVEHTIGVYLDYAGIGVAFEYSGYDDSFSFFELDSAADAVIIWIDTTRYEEGKAQKLLEERIEQLKLRYKKPILLIPFGESITIRSRGVVVFDLGNISAALGEQFVDERARNVAGTVVSGKALLSISRELGLRYLPAILCPTLKAVIVDLDNTLYLGILGEDGADGLTLTDGHRKLQEYLKQLAGQGFFLCIASKNERQDVDTMFAFRRDFPLNINDFSIVCASWVSKGEMIWEMAKYLNIDPSSMVFVDDNIGELKAVELAVPSIHLIHASGDGDKTRTVLEQYPGLLKLSSTVEDGKRKVDVQANAERYRLQRVMSKTDYIRSLYIDLVFCVNNTDQIQRVAELANKTNQFIFNYKRYTQQEVEMRMLSKQYKVVTISLKDKLSDSGLIGVCVGRNNKDYVEIEECFVSCRALGRGIDDVVVLGAVQEICNEFQQSKVKVLFQRGDRNTPAEMFVTDHLVSYVQKPQTFTFEIPRDLVSVKIIR